MSAEMQEAPRGPVAWLVMGGRTFVDRPFIRKDSAEMSAMHRSDGAKVIPLYASPSSSPDLLQMLHECAEYIAALNGEQDDYCQRARALIARATGDK